MLVAGKVNGHPKSRSHSTDTLMLITQPARAAPCCGSAKAVIDESGFIPGLGVGPKREVPSRYRAALHLVAGPDIAHALDKGRSRHGIQCGGTIEVEAVDNRAVCLSCRHRYSATSDVGIDNYGLRLAHREKLFDQAYWEHTTMPRVCDSLMTKDRGFQWSC